MLKHGLLLLLACSGTSYAALGGLFGGPKANLEIVMQPTHPEVAKLDKIAVFDFAGADGVSFANALRSELTEAVVNGERSFDIVSSATLNLSKLTIPGIIAAGKKLGVEAIYYGSIEQAAATRTSTNEQRTKCTKSKGLFKGCEKGYEQKVNVRCSVITGTYQATVNVLSVASGRVLYANQIPAGKAFKQCDGDNSVPITDAMVLGAARGEIIRQVVVDVVPRTEVVQVELKRAQDLDRKDKKTFNDAMKAAKAGRWNKACGRWESLGEKYEDNVALLYTLGLCSEYLGDLDYASQLYQQADALVIDDAAINSALDRVKGSRAAAADQD